MKFILIALLVTTIAVARSIANPSDRQQRQATVPRCPDVCLAVYDPVCGSNRRRIRSFGNSCEMGIYNCNNPSNQYELVPNHYCCKFANGGVYNAPIADNPICLSRLS